MSEEKSLHRRLEGIERPEAVSAPCLPGEQFPDEACTCLPANQAVAVGAFVFGSSERKVVMEV